MKKENIFITWHYTTHGIAYLKHILSAFYNRSISFDSLTKTNISQIGMNKVFEIESRGFLFDKVYYLTAGQDIFDKISARRFNYWQQIVEKDDHVKQTKAIKVWQDLEKEYIKNNNQNINLYNRFDNINEVIFYVKEKFPNLFEEWKSQIWRDIQHFKIDDQINWFRRHSNTHKNYREKNIFIEKKFENLKDLRDPVDIYQNIKPFIDQIKEIHPKANIVINAVLGSNETQVVWQILSELDILPQNTKLIRTYDNKANNPNERFKDFDIQEISAKIVTKIKNLQLRDTKPESKRNIIAEKKFRNYAKQGFSILLIGERGIGKSHMAESNAEKKEIIVANCASFANDDLAASQLFGYVKGAFTGADKDTNGFFQQAEGKILFLDEIHHLSKSIQSQLFRAIQTDENNNFKIRKVGSDKEEKIKTTLIFATNISIQELRKKLLPDFYDRIVQLVIEIPSLRDSKKDLGKLFKDVWGEKNMQFPNYPNDKELIKWIKTLELKGNFRDLQRIAILYKTYNDFDEELKEIINYNSALDFTKAEYKKYIEVEKSDENDLMYKLFSDKHNETDLLNLYRRELAMYFINRYNGARKASDHFKSLEGTIAPETLLRWKNAKLSFE